VVGRVPGLLSWAPSWAPSGQGRTSPWTSPQAIIRSRLRRSRTRAITATKERLNRPGKQSQSPLNRAPLRSDSNGTKLKKIWDDLFTRMATPSYAVLRPEGADSPEPRVERSETRGKDQKNVGRPAGARDCVCRCGNYRVKIPRVMQFQDPSAFLTAGEKFRLRSLTYCEVPGSASTGSRTDPEGRTMAKKT
jgi:hypothetical protein